MNHYIPATFSLIYPAAPLRRMRAYPCIHCGARIAPRAMASQVTRERPAKTARERAEFGATVPLAPGFLCINCCKKVLSND